MGYEQNRHPVANALVTATSCKRGAMTGCSDDVYMAAKRTSNLGLLRYERTKDFITEHLAVTVYMTLTL